MDLLDLSDSESESASEADEEAKGEQDGGLAKQEDIYEMAIQSMLTINETNSLEQMTETIERSILTAIRAYKQSNLLM